MANPNFTCVLDAWREGTTLFGRMHYYRSGTFTYQDTNFPDPTMNLGGTVFTDTDFGNRVRAGISVGDVYTTTFSRTVSGTGTRTVTFTAGSGLRSDFEGTWSVDVGGFPGTNTPPTGLTFTGCTAGPDWYDVSLSITGWGNGGSAEQRYIEANIAQRNDSTVDTNNRRFQSVYGVTSATIRVTNSSQQLGGFNIIPNTINTVGIYATNGAADTGVVRIGNHCSAPPVMSTYVTVTTYNNATLSWSFGNQGGAFPLSVQYSLDGTNWTTASTESSAGAKSGSYTITGLTPGTTYSVRTRLLSQSGQPYDSTNGNTVTVTTPPPPSSTAFYGSVNGQTKKVTKLYGSVNGQTKLITKLYGSVNGVTKRIL